MIYYFTFSCHMMSLLLCTASNVNISQSRLLSIANFVRCIVTKGHLIFVDVHCT